ncbi:MAG: hypothetical protein QXP36_02070 [Conexivisphaerales archaeon]
MPRSISTYIVSIVANLNNGKSIDISDAVISIKITQSVVYDAPVVEIYMFAKYIELLIDSLQTIDLTIDSYIRSSNMKHRVIYNLTPCDLNSLKVSLDTKNVTGYLESYQLRLSLYFWITPCYNAAITNTVSKSYFNTTIQQILNEITDTSVVEKIEYNILNTTPIEQVLLKQIPYISQLDQLDFYFGLTPNVCPRVINPSFTDKTKCVVNILDTKEAVEKNAYTATIHIVSDQTMSDALSQEYKDPSHYLSLGHYKVENNQQNTFSNNYLTVTKPSNTLYQLNSYGPTELATYYKNVDISLNSLKTVYNDFHPIVITSETGNTNSDSWAKSIFGEFLLFSSRLHVGIYEPATIQNLQPGHVVNVDISVTKDIPYSGLYMVESVIQTFAISSSADWKNTTTVTLVRTNTQWS